MIRIEVNKKELEDLIDSLKDNFNSLGEKISLGKNDGEIDNISFDDFKKYFCDDNIDFYKLNNNLKLFKIIYGKISSDNSLFYLNIRNYIIEKFSKEIKFCPYCGKNPLIFFEKGKDKVNSYHRLFQFDHFFPKNYYHKGIINFYNLIPCCNACNHLKLEDNPLKIINKKGTVFHPYFGNIYLDENNILQRDFQRNADIKLNYVSKNSKFFKFAQKYLNSQDTFNDFDFIQDKRTKAKDLKQFFPGISDEKLKNHFFESYYPKKEEDILKYGNGKLKKDLIENLKF